ncbi:MAG: hypothetical protein R3B91_23175 [Planctomycetaceae bacterium]
MQAAVVADQHVLASDYHPLRTGLLDRLRFELPGDKNWCSGLKMNKATQRAVSRFSCTDAGTLLAKSISYFCTAYPLSRASDENGLVTLPYFLPGETVELYVRTPEGEWELREIKVPQSGEVCSLVIELLTDEQI